MLKNRLEKILKGMKKVCAVNKERRTLLANFKTSRKSIALNKWKHAYLFETNVKAFKLRLESALKGEVFAVLKRRIEVIKMLG